MGARGSDSDAVTSMISDSRYGVTDGWTIEDYSVDDFCKETVSVFRNSMASRKPDHVWIQLPDDEFLRVIGAAKIEDGVLKPTIAGLMMFGYDYHISSVLGYYCLEYREYELGGDEWTYRLLSTIEDWSGNVYDSYRTIVNRIRVRMGRRFEIDGQMKNVDDSDMDKVVREAILNALVHVDYGGRRGIVVEFRPDSLTISNPGVFRIPLEMAAQCGTSDSRNMTLSKMFTLVGDAERAGNGIHRMFLLCRRQGAPPPSFRELVEPARVEVCIGFVGYPHSQGVTMKGSSR